ncbi:hypothetical protein GCM10009647_062170 [Streptomyces sanglieri]
MVFKRFKTQFISHYSQPKVRRGLKATIIVLIGAGWILSQYITNLLTLEQTLLMGLILLLMSLEIVETKIYDIEELFDQPVQVRKDNYAVKDNISSYLDSNNPEKGFIISYSGSTGTSKSPTKRMIKQGTKVHILAKNPLEAINKDETELILEALKSRYEFDKEYDDIEVRFYHEQASIKGLKANGLLVMSWYTFADERGRQVMGHENPALKVDESSEYEFEVLSDYFEEVYFSLWKAGMTPIELYDHEDCPVDLERWVSRQRDSEREDWLRSISGVSYTSKEEMFQS